MNEEEIRETLTKSPIAPLAVLRSEGGGFLPSLKVFFRMGESSFFFLLYRPMPRLFFLRGGIGLRFFGWKEWGEEEDVWGGRKRTVKREGRERKEEERHAFEGLVRSHATGKKGPES